MTDSRFPSPDEGIKGAQEIARSEIIIEGSAGAACGSGDIGIYPKITTDEAGMMMMTSRSSREATWLPRTVIVAR